MRDIAKFLLLIVCFFALSLVGSVAAAQTTCVGGREISPRTAGRCCWPGQSWSRRDGRCAGPPRCPRGMASEGDSCVVSANTGETREPAVAPAPRAESRHQRSRGPGGAALQPRTERAYVAAPERASDEDFARARDSLMPGFVAGRFGLGLLFSYGLSSVLVLSTVVPIVLTCRTAECAFVGSNFAVSLSVLLGTASGITLSGAALRGMSHFGWALLGSLIGMTVLVPVSLLVPVGNNPGVAAGVLLGAAMVPTIGAALAYEFSSATNANRILREAAPRRSGSGPLVLPYATRDGMGLSVGWAF